MAPLLKPGQQRTITIEGKVLRVAYEELPLDQVQLDPENPRIREAVKRASKNGKIDPEELRQIIWGLPAVPELFKSIRDNQGLLEPIYVRADGRVAEGNCRTVIYERLLKANSHDRKWQKIPAYRLPRNVTDRQVAVLQGMFHVAGKITWRAHEQSGHLYFMYKTLGMSHKAIAKALGMQERVVTQLIESYEVSVNKLFPAMAKKVGAGEKIKSGEALEKHSYVREFFKIKKLKDFREKRESNVNWFVKLVATNKLTRGAQVRDLPAIIANPKAREVLERDGHAKAMEVLSRKDPTIGSPLFRLIERATTALKEMEAPDIDRIRHGAKEQQLLQRLQAALNNVASTTNIKLR